MVLLLDVTFSQWKAESWYSENYGSTLKHQLGQTILCEWQMWRLKIRFVSFGDSPVKAETAICVLIIVVSSELLMPRLANRPRKMMPNCCANAKVTS